MAEALRREGWSWEEHCRDLPGRPDFVFRDQRIVVFVDGDFWHGWRFPAWRHKLSERWEEKIHKNRCRDARNHRRLRRSGWLVIRLWEHQVAQDLESCINRVRVLMEIPRRQSRSPSADPRNAAPLPELEG